MKIIRHKSFKDICFEVTSVSLTQVTGCWLNMGYVKSWALPVQAETISLTNPQDWEECLDPNVKCLRYARWK